ncbi:MAG TPA: hypothetical protein VIH18_02235, partial [Candidatus Binatia bacterium]
MVYSETHDMLLSAVENLPPVVLPDDVIMQQAAFQRHARESRHPGTVRRLLINIDKILSDAK